MAIVSDNPTTIPAKTFDQYWLTRMSVAAANPNGVVQVRATFAKSRTVDGSIELLVGSERTYVISDLFALAAENEEVNSLVGSLLTTLGALAKSDGVIE